MIADTCNPSIGDQGRSLDQPSMGYILSTRSARATLQDSVSKNKAKISVSKGIQFLGMITHACKITSSRHHRRNLVSLKQKTNQKNPTFYSLFLDSLRKMAIFVKN